MKTNRKGQAAMEFLMTYGWAILVVIAAIAVLAASGLLDFSKYTPDKCSFGNQISCIGTASISSTDVYVSFRNALDTTITLTDINLTGTCNTGSITVAEGSAGSYVAIGAGLDVSKGEVLKVHYDCTGVELSSGEVLEETMTLEYTRADSGTPYSVTGDIKGKIA